MISIFGSLLAVNILKPSNPARAASPGDWTAYLNNPGHTGFNSAETAINPTTAGSLKQLWSISEGSIISTQPVVANGLIYWGSWDGIEHATNLNGTQAWATNIGTGATNCPDPGGPTSEGVLSTATIASVTINGTPTTVDFVGSASDTFYALNASTGAVIWQVSLGSPPDQVVWSSPTLYNGSIYIGPGISVAATVSVDTIATPTCTGIVAERPMYFNALGTNSGSDVLGVTSPGTTFYFADLATGTQAGGG